MKIDINKKYKTREGKEVIIYEILDNPYLTYPIIGRISGIPRADSWRSDGSFVDKGDLDLYDLVEIKPSLTFWVNCYPESSRNHCYDTKDTADFYASPGRIACVEITVEEGDGL